MIRLSSRIKLSKLRPHHHQLIRPPSIVLQQSHTTTRRASIVHLPLQQLQRRHIRLLSIVLRPKPIITPSRSPVLLLPLPHRLLQPRIQQLNIVHQPRHTTIRSPLLAQLLPLLRRLHTLPRSTVHQLRAIITRCLSIARQQPQHQLPPQPIQLPSTARRPRATIIHTASIAPLQQLLQHPHQLILIPPRQQCQPPPHTQQLSIVHPRSHTTTRTLSIARLLQQRPLQHLLLTARPSTVRPPRPITTRIHLCVQQPQPQLPALIMQLRNTVPQLGPIIILRPLLAQLQAQRL